MATHTSALRVEEIVSATGMEDHGMAERRDCLNDDEIELMYACSEVVSWTLRESSISAAIPWLHRDTAVGEVYDCLAGMYLYGEWSRAANIGAVVLFIRLLTRCSQEPNAAQPLPMSPVLVDPVAFELSVLTIQKGPLAVKPCGRNHGKGLQKL